MGHFRRSNWATLDDRTHGCLSFQDHGAGDERRGFSVKEDGSGTLLGAAFKEVLTAPFTTVTNFAVSTDLSTFGKATPEDNLDALANASLTPGSWWQQGNGTIQIKAGGTSQPGSFAGGMRILAVWVGPDDSQPIGPDDPGQFLDPLDS